MNIFGGLAKLFNSETIFDLCKSVSCNEKTYILSMR